MRPPARLSAAALIVATVLWVLAVEPSVDQEPLGMDGEVSRDGVPSLATMPERPVEDAATDDQIRRTSLVLQGEVRGWQGATVARGRVSLARAEHGELLRLGESLISSTGTFRIESPVRAPADVALWAESGTESSLQMRLSCMPGESRTVTLFLVPTGHMTVRVVSDRGVPQAGAAIRLTCALAVNAPPERTASTDSLGECAFVAPFGPCTIRVELPSGYRQGIYSENWQAQFRDGLILVEVPSELEGVPVRLQLPEGVGEAGIARVHLRWGRQFSLFSMKADGSTVVRYFDRARGQGRVSATVRLSSPDAEWTYAWQSREAAMRAGVVELGTPAIADARICVELREPRVPLRYASLVLRSKYVSCKARTDAEGIAHTRLPPDVYQVECRGTMIGRLAIPPGRSEPRLEVVGWGTLHVRLEGLDQWDDLRLRVRSKETAVGGARSSRRSPREFEARLSQSDQAVAVPWPTGSEVSLQLRKRRRTLGVPVDAVVGGPIALLTASGAEGQPVDVVIRLNLTVPRARIGDLQLVPIPRVASQPPVSAEIDQGTSEARFRDLSPGRYEVHFVDRIAERTFVAEEQLTISAEQRTYVVHVANDALR